VRRPMLVPCDPPTPPEYCVIGGIVCVPLTEPFLRCAYGESYLQDAPLPLLQCLHQGMKQSEDHQVVLVTQVLASSLTVGFQGFTNTQVTHLNGAPIRNLAHLCALYDACQDEWLRFELASEDTLVLSTKEARLRTPEIMQKNMIAKDRQIEVAPAAPEPRKPEPSPVAKGKGKAADHAE